MQWYLMIIDSSIIFKYYMHRGIIFKYFNYMSKLVMIQVPFLNGHLWFFVDIGQLCYSSSSAVTANLLPCYWLTIILYFVVRNEGGTKFFKKKLDIGSSSLVAQSLRVDMPSHLILSVVPKIIFGFKWMSWDIMMPTHSRPDDIF